MQGHIRKRSKDSWTVVVDMGRDPKTGKRSQLLRSLRGTKREAEALLAQLIHQRETGVDAPPGRMTVGRFLDYWLSTYAQPRVAPKTFRRYEQLIRVHLSPALGSVTLTKLRPLNIQEAYNEIQAKGRSTRTVLHCHRLLRETLSHAVKWGLLARNSTDAVEAPRPSKYVPMSVGTEDLRKLLAAAGETPYDALVHLALTTGLRQGELLGLRWQDIDFAGGTLCVRQTNQWLPREGFMIRQPKTHRSTRPVAVPASAMVALQSHRAEQLEERLSAGPAYRGRDLVFADAVVSQFTPAISGRRGLRWQRLPAWWACGFTTSAMLMLLFYCSKESIRRSCQSASGTLL